MNGIGCDLLPLDAMAGHIPGFMAANPIPIKEENLVMGNPRIESGLDSSISSGDSKNESAQQQIQAQLSMNPYAFVLPKPTTCSALKISVVFSYLRVL